MRREQRHGPVTAVLGEVGAVGGPLHHHKRRSIPYVEVVDPERHELAHPHAGREQGLDDEPVAGTLAGVEHALDVPRAERLRPFVLRLPGPWDAFDAGEPDRLVSGCARAEPRQRAEVGSVLGHRRSAEHAGEIREEPLEAFDREVLEVADSDLVPPEREPARGVDQVVPAVAKRSRRPVEGVAPSIASTASVTLAVARAARPWRRRVRRQGSSSPLARPGSDAYTQPQFRNRRVAPSDRLFSRSWSWY